MVGSALCSCRLRSLDLGRGKQGGRQSNIRPSQTLNYGASRVGTLWLVGALVLLGSHADRTKEKL